MKRNIAVMLINIIMIVISVIPVEAGRINYSSYLGVWEKRDAVHEGINITSCTDDTMDFTFYCQQFEVDITNATIVGTSVYGNYYEVWDDGVDWDNYVVSGNVRLRLYEDSVVAEWISYENGKGPSSYSMVLYNDEFVYTEKTENIKVILNGTELFFDVAPIIENDRTLVPVRAISEHLGYEVNWNQESEMVEIKNSDDVMQIYIGKRNYISKGESKILDAPAKIENGRTLVPLRLIAENFGCEVEWEQETRTVIISKYNIVEAADASQLLENIKDYTKIVLTAPEYNLTEVESVANINIVKENVFDGYEYVIREVEGLVIEPAAGVDATLVVTPRYSDVLQFRDCKDVSIKNITAGHTVEQGYCVGGVICFENTKDADVDACRLYGCGTYGVTGSSSSGIKVTNTEIYECTYGCVQFSECSNVEFKSCVFRNCDAFSAFSFVGCDGIWVKDSVIKDNINSEWPFIEASNSKNVNFSNCEFLNNTYVEFCDNEEVRFDNCKL